MSPARWLTGLIVFVLLLVSLCVGGGTSARGRAPLVPTATLRGGGGALAGSAPVLRSIEFQDRFASGKLDAWAFPYPEDWAILTGGPLHYLHMRRSREPGVPRRPLQFALLKDINMASFELETRVRREGRSMMIVFGYVDTLHFYYAHLSEDMGSKEPVHNGIFIVNGEPRKRIAGLEAAPVLPDREWHKVRLIRDAMTGSIQLFVDGGAQPRFSVQDTTFTCGRIGLGSFDETGDFANVKLVAHDVDCVPGNQVRTQPASTE